MIQNKTFILLLTVFLLTHPVSADENIETKVLYEAVISELAIDQQGFFERLETELSKVQKSGEQSRKTLEHIYQLHAAHFYLYDLEKASRYAKLGLTLATQFSADSMAIDFHYSLASKAAEVDRDFSVAIHHFSEALSIASKHENNAQYYDILAAQGATKVSFGLYNSGTDDLIEALRYSELNSPRAETARILTEIAFAYDSVNDHENALKYMRQSLDYGDENEPIYHAVTKMNLVAFLINNKQYQEAGEVLIDACNDMQELEDDRGIADCARNMGRLAIEKEQYTQALTFLNQALTTYSQIDFTSGIETANTYKIKALSALGRHSEVEAILNEYDAKNSNQLIWKEAMLTSAEAKEDWYQAFKISQEILQRSLADRTQKSEEMLEAMQVKFGLDEEKLKNETLVKQNEIILLEQEKKQLYFIIAIFLVFLMSLITATLFWVHLKTRRSKDKFKTFAMTDPLTKTLNRRGILRQLENKIHEFANAGVGLTIAIVDFDKFKVVNDTYGHDAGDQLLISFAEAFKNSQRGSDLLGRLGGDEWLMLFPTAEPETVKACLQRVMKLYQELAEVRIDENVIAEFSAGVVKVTHDNFGDVDKLLKEADEALYKVKKSRQ